MKRYRLLSLVFAIIMLLTSLSLPAFADSKDTTVYPSMSKACDVIRKGIIDRRKDVNTSCDYYFTVVYKANSYDSKKIYDQVENEVFKYTGKYYEGDGLRLSICQEGWSISGKKVGDVYHITVLAYGDFYLTKDKTNQINKWVKDNSNYLATKKYKTGTSEYGKALGIYRWITKNCKYGKTEISGQWEPWNTAYGAKYKKGTCSGISHLYYMMANAVGLKCRLMRCYNHQWVIVRVSGKWYIVDPTFGLGKSTSYDKSYFLVGSSNYSNYAQRWKDEYGGNIAVNKTRYKK